jgi:hypothetical protein
MFEHDELPQPHRGTRPVPAVPHVFFAEREAACCGRSRHFREIYERNALVEGIRARCMRPGCVGVLSNDGRFRNDLRLNCYDARKS